MILSRASATRIESVSCEIEWPPKGGRLIRVPEVDRAEWFTLDAGVNHDGKNIAPRHRPPLRRQQRAQSHPRRRPRPSLALIEWSNPHLCEMKCDSRSLLQEAVTGREHALTATLQ
jgi:hypothetical protein